MVMFTGHTSTPQSTTGPPQSPTRVVRLRGLSCFRNYTQHLHRRSESSESASRQFSPLPSPGPIITTTTTDSSQPLSPEEYCNTSLLSAASPISLVAPPPSAATSPAHPPPNSPFPPIDTSRSQESKMSLPPPPAGHPALVANNQNISSSTTTQQQSEPQMPSIRFVPHHDPRATRPSLTFQAISRTLPSHEAIIKVGRYSERDQYGGDLGRGSGTSASPVGFKSKVVSRKHCEFWCDKGQWYIKDVKSSSGTFLNHLRLSPPGVESKPWPVNDGDVVQLGIDFKGGEEPIYRCVKIRIECNRSWQKGPNPFNKTTHRRIRKLAAQRTAKRDSDTASLNSTDCTICLMSISPCQSLFVAPCSHVWHYKCIRPILNGPGYPNLLCPNCRACIDLEADIEEADSDWEDDLQEAIEASKQESNDEDTNKVMGGTTDTVTTNGPAATIQPSGNPRNVTTVDTDGDYDMLDANTSDSHAPGRNQAPPPSRAAPPAPIVLAQPQHISNGEPMRTEGGSAGTNLPTPPRNIPRPNGTIAGEGPMTPRNDAGPFVLDGGAGRTSTRRDASGATAIAPGS